MGQLGLSVIKQGWWPTFHAVKGKRSNAFTYLFGISTGRSLHDELYKSFSQNAIAEQR